MSKPSNNVTVFTFMFFLCFICAFLLSLLAGALRPAQAQAEELDRSKQMLMAAQIYHPDGYFLVQNRDGKSMPAKYDETKKMLVPGSVDDKASAADIFTIYKERIQAYVVSDKGKMMTFEEAGLNEKEYVADNQKGGYAALPYKLLYQILANGAKSRGVNTPIKDVMGYVFPVSGMGLWDRIYGYLSVARDGNTVIGVSWYQQKETAGLGANIADPPWQEQFPGKKIFLADGQGQTNFQKAPIGLTVVRGRVSDLYGTSPKAMSSLDGISGATLTGNGVTAAYKDSLSPYREFLVRLHEASKGKKAA